MSKLLQRLSDPSRSGVYRAPDSAIEEVLAASTIEAIRVALHGALTKESILERLAQGAGFPEWFGRNWDAAEDCLTDLSWRQSQVHVLLFSGAQPSDNLGVLQDVLAVAADYWRARATPFFAVFVDPQGALDLPALYRAR